MQQHQAIQQLDALAGQLTLGSGSAEENASVVDTITALCGSLDMTRAVHEALTEAVRGLDCQRVGLVFDMLLKPGSYDLDCETESFSYDDGTYGTSVDRIRVRDGNGFDLWLPRDCDLVGGDDLTGACIRPEIVAAVQGAECDPDWDGDLFALPELAGVDFAMLFRAASYLFEQYDYQNIYVVEVSKAENGAGIASVP